MISAPAKRWEIRTPDPDALDNLVDQRLASPLLAGLLVNRGITGLAETASFLSPTLGRIHDPYLLAGMKKSVARLVEALEKGERVCVHGDYDVDGITATALLASFFMAIGLNCSWYIPNRLLDGYGLSADGVRIAASRGARVIVTVDCGTTAVEEAELCAELGIDLIITDHHLPGAVLPAAYSIINPLQPDCAFPFKALAGVGVAFNLLIALRGRLREKGFFAGRGEPDLRRYLDLVALGTVADVVPLVDENRIFVVHGLKELSKPSRPGIKALKAVAGLNDEVGSGAVGFRLAPRLNACGRLDDASLGVELLLTDDQDEAAAMATRLDVGNVQRQTMEKEILRQAIDMFMADPDLHRQKGIVMASAAWHPGVIGIVASRLVEMFHRPTILIALEKGNGKGSGRSIKAFHLLDALNSCAGNLLKFGGHRHAAGLAVAEDTLDAFAAQFIAVAEELLTADDLIPVLTLDGELLPESITCGLVTELALLKPFGMGNPEPLFLMKEAMVTDCRVLKGSHLRLRLAAGGRTFAAVAFGMAGRAVHGDLLDIVFAPAINNWNGSSSLQLNIKDLRRSGSDSAKD